MRLGIGAGPQIRVRTDKMTREPRSDVASPGSKRKQRKGGGFATKAAAVEAMNRHQSAVVDGTHVERSRRTLGAYGCGIHKVRQAAIGAAN